MVEFYSTGADNTGTGKAVTGKLVRRDLSSHSKPIVYIASAVWVYARRTSPHMSHGPAVTRVSSDVRE